MPVLIKTIPFIPRRKKAAGAQAPVAAAPVLVAASRDEYDLTLVFDRPVSIPAEMTTNEIAVYDGVFDIEYRNTASATQAGPDTVVVNVLEFAEYTGPGVTLSASGATGIVAADGGGQWAGVSGVALPFP